jgi:HSP20 family protein
LGAIKQALTLNLTPLGVSLKEEIMVSITRRENTPNLFGLQRLNRILDEAFAGLPFPDQGGNILTASWVPPTDVSEDANSIRISMELAGVNPDDVRISLENNVLTIRGEKQQEEEESDDRVHRIERIYGMFQRTFVLPNTVDPERIEARHENGVLTVSIPKTERARPREIRVNSSVSSASEVKTSRSAGSPATKGIGTQSAEGTGTRASEGTGTQAGNGGEQAGSSRPSSSRSGEEGSTRR